jgi:hypothetical protein
VISQPVTAASLPLRCLPDRCGVPCAQHTQLVTAEFAPNFLSAFKASVSAKFQPCVAPPPPARRAKKRSGTPAAVEVFSPSDRQQQQQQHDSSHSVQSVSPESTTSVVTSVAPVVAPATASTVAPAAAAEGVGTELRVQKLPTHKKARRRGKQLQFTPQATQILDKLIADQAAVAKEDILYTMQSQQNYELTRYATAATGCVIWVEMPFLTVNMWRL